MLYFFGISLGIKWRMIDVGKTKFLLFAKCFKGYSFFPFAFLVCKKCYYDPNIFLHEKYQSG